MLAILAQTSSSYLGFDQQSGSGATYAVLGGFIALIALIVAVNAARGKRDKRRAKGGGKNGRSTRKRKTRAKDALAEFVVPYLDLDQLINPPEGRHRPIPEELQLGTVLISQRMGIKCLLLDSLEEVGKDTLKDICARKLRPNQVLYVPMGTQIYKDEILHQGKGFATRIRKGTLFLSVGGHPNTYLLESLKLPLRKELNSNHQILPVTELTAQRYLQSLIDIPSSFELLKEDVLFDTSAENVRTVEKGTLILSRSGALVGLMLEKYDLPHKGPLSDLEALFQLKTIYQRFPLETLIQEADKAGGRSITIEKGTFIFSSAGKVYFTWRDGLAVDKKQLVDWSLWSQINDPSLLEVSKTKSNSIGGPGEVITQDELNYLRDVFRQAGTTNIRVGTLLLDRSIFYKFVHEMPYAQTGKFRSHIGKGVQILNSTSLGTFSVELGGSNVEITGLDLEAVRKHLLPEGKLLIRIGTKLRILDERLGDWVYLVTTNLFYPYGTLTRPYMEEFIPENIRFDSREPKISTIIGEQKHPASEDIGASGEPLGDLLALINYELFQTEPRIVFVLDGTLFHWGQKGRLYRVNEELVFRPQKYSDRLKNQDLEALAADWKINPVVDDAQEDEEEVPVFDEEEDLEDLPFDTGAVR